MLSYNKLPLGVGDYVIFAEIHYGEPVLETGHIVEVGSNSVVISSESVGYVVRYASQVYKPEMFNVS